MSSRSLVDPLVSELINRLAKGDRITREHLKFFLDDPDMVLPVDFLLVREKLLFLLPKEDLGFKRATYESGAGGDKLLYVARHPDGEIVLLNGNKVTWPCRGVYGHDNSVVGEEVGPTFHKGWPVVACLLNDGKWVMCWAESGKSRFYDLPGAPVMQPIVVGDLPACVSRFVGDGETKYFVTRGLETYGPYKEVDPKSLVSLEHAVGYAARNGRGKVSVYVADHKLVFPASVSGEEVFEWDEIKDLVASQGELQKDESISSLFSFIAVDRGEQLAFQIFHCGRPVAICDHELENLAIAHDAEKRCGADALVYTILADDGTLTVEHTTHGSSGWGEVRELRLQTGAPLFVGKRNGQEFAVWASEKFGPFEEVMGLQVVNGQCLFIAREDDKYFVVVRFHEKNQNLGVSNPDLIRDYKVLYDDILQVVADESDEYETIYHGFKGSRRYERIFGVEVNDEGTVKFCAQRGRRIIIGSFDPS